MEGNLEEIIRLRTAARQQGHLEKRREDVKRILEMKKNPNTGVSPLELCPKEMWVRIFQYLDPATISSVKLAHTIFDHLTQFHVFLLLPQLWKSCSGVGVLRGVCKSTMKLVHRHIDKNLALCIRNEDHIGSILNSVKLERSTLAAMITDFNRKDGKFFSRWISVDCTHLQGDAFTQFSTDVLTLLRSIGGQIWVFEFSVLIMERDNVAPAFTLFQKCVSLLRNLKWIKLEILFQVDEPGEIVYPASEFPFLPELERVSFTLQPHGNTIPILEQLLVPNQHVKIFEMIGGLLPLPPYVMSLPLTSFSVTSVFETIDRRAQLINHAWQLRTIDLDLTQLKFLFIGHLFIHLENFQALENLTLRNVTAVVHHPTFLRLPNLKHLNIHAEPSTINYNTNVEFFYSFNFLIKCSRLTTLTWKLVVPDMEKLRNHLLLRERGSVNFRAGLRVLYESNIWDVFPELKTVKIEGCCKHEYSRIYGVDKLDPTWRQNVVERECGNYNCVFFLDGWRVREE